MRELGATLKATARRAWSGRQASATDAGLTTTQPEQGGRRPPWTPRKRCCRRPSREPEGTRRGYQLPLRLKAGDKCPQMSAGIHRLGSSDVVRSRYTKQSSFTPPAPRPPDCGAAGAAGVAFGNRFGDDLRSGRTGDCGRTPHRKSSPRASMPLPLPKISTARTTIAHWTMIRVQLPYTHATPRGFEPEGRSFKRSLFTLCVHRPADLRR